MKIRAVVRFDDSEQTFIVPCGTGDKTFKWLGNAVSQRYAMSAPNGTLRSREHFCGISERVQYLANNIMVPSGNNPHPAELLHDHLHDGDTVIVDMSSKVQVKKVSGAPNATSWTTLAYSVSQDHLHADLADVDEDDGEEEDGEEDEDSEHYTASELQAKRASKVNFLKLMLKSQVINDKEVNRQVADIWGLISPKLRLMKEDDQEDFKNILRSYWDIFLDIFAAYQAPEDALPSSVTKSRGDTMLIDLERFVCLVEDAGIFPAVHIHMQTQLIYNHALSYFPMAAHGLYLEGFLLALIFTAQLKYNDTLDSKLRSPTKQSSLSASSSTTSLRHSKSSTQITSNVLGQFMWSSVLDFRRLVEEYILPLAKDLGCHSHLRAVFLSDTCLAKIRDKYEVLQATFDKESVKVRDFPTTISADAMCELLYNAGLTPTMGTTADVDKCRMLLEEVRHGSIHGRQSGISEEDERFLYPEEDFTFAEFVEAVARAGYYCFKDAAQKKAAAAAAAGEVDEDVSH